MLGIKPWAAMSGSKNANNCAMLPPTPLQLLIKSDPKLENYWLVPALDTKRDSRSKKIVISDRGRNWTGTDLSLVKKKIRLGFKHLNEIKLSTDLRGGIKIRKVWGIDEANKNQKVSSSFLNQSKLKKLHDNILVHTHSSFQYEPVTPNSNRFKHCF